MKTTISLLTMSVLLLSGMSYTHNHVTDNFLTEAEDLKLEAFKILDSKCNACHRKQNPFIVFSQKNMEQRAPKIYQQVYVEQRMPKGNTISLTKEEYLILEKWLQKISQQKN